MPTTKNVLTRLRASTMLTSVVIIFSSTPIAYALPVGGNVVAGQATIATAPQRLDVTQSTNRAVLDWQSFDIGAGEQVKFAQPSSQSVALNRVTGGQNASQILGKLDANGTVMLVNPQGVVFG